MGAVKNALIEFMDDFDLDWADVVTDDDWDVISEWWTEYASQRRSR